MIQLVKRSISGDADAFLELMEKNSLAMFKVARGILDNDEDAADAIQDTILTCFEKIHTLKNPEYFKTWMNMNQRCPASVGKFSNIRDISFIDVSLSICPHNIGRIL